MDRDAFVRLLNEDLELEYRSIVQYIQHVATVKGAEYQAVLGEIETHIGQEVEHALALSRQIDFLGAVPTVHVPAFEAVTDADAALRQDLALEEAQLDRYRERFSQAEDLGLPDVAETLSPLLEQTQDHVRDLRSALG